MKQLHNTQLQIMRSLVFSQGLKFSELKPDKEMDNNKFTFHLSKLIDAGYVESEDGYYKLTDSGKSYANRLDTEKVTVKPQAKLSAWLICRRQREEVEYLIYTRLKHPFYGCQGFPSGKIDHGEKVIETAKRELFEEAGLAGKPEVIHLRHYLVYDSKGIELKEDKFMFMCLFDEPEGELEPDPTEGKYEWVRESELKGYVTNHFESWGAFSEQLQIIKDYDGTLTMAEVVHNSGKY